MAGHIIRDKDLTSIRPGTGILGNKIDLFIGKNKNVFNGSFVKVSDFEKNKTLVILGSGGHARPFLEVLEKIYPSTKKIILDENFKKIKMKKFGNSNCWKF